MTSSHRSPPRPKVTPPGTGGGWSAKLALAAVVACGFGYGVAHQLRQHLQARAQSAARQQLDAIAEMKVRQITSWREERLADARFFSQARFVANDFRRYLADPPSEDAQASISNWLRLLKRGDRYAAVLLLDCELQVRERLPASAMVPAAHLRALYTQAIATGDVVMGELYLDETTGRPQQDVLLPIYDDPERRTSAPLGAVLIQLDPDQLLYPLVQSWPTPSRSAETLLIRRDGDDVLYLNELRHRSGSALKLRLPFDSQSLPAAKVLQGHTEVHEGTDYRGVPVVYVGRWVPGTSWAMIAKADQEELYAPARQQTLLTVLVASSFVLGTLLVFNLYWQRRNARLISQLRLQAAALEAAANGIVITRCDGTIEWVNAAFTQLTGYAATDVLGAKPSLLRSGRHPREWYRTMWETILAGQPWHGELVNRRKDGVLYDEEMTITPVGDARGRISHFVAIKQDVTRRKQAEQQQARMRDDLESLVAQRTALLSEIVDELEHFSYSITHDMRAPLRAMNTYAVMLQRKFGAQLPDEALGFVRRIEAAASRLDGLIRDSLNYSKALRADLPLQPIDLAPLLRGLLDSYPNLQPPGADIAIEFETLWVQGNESGLTQCFSNLLGNAVKFVAEGTRPQIRVTAKHRPVDGRPPMTRVAVHDNGIGIPAESHEAIFGMFQRLHGPDAYPGTGIGLALVRKVVQRMGGAVGVQSTPGAGSVFWIELQRTPAHDSPDHSPG